MRRPYYDFNSFLRKEFGCRVQKITLDAGFSCPNRDGTLSVEGCTFCDGKGSGSGALKRGETIVEQIRNGKARLIRRYKAKKFIAYFQSFTNTYAPVPVLKEAYDQALTDPDVVGLAIGTRPDCVDGPILDLIQAYGRTRMVWIEYGLQSMHNRTLERINRGHRFEDFVHAVRLTQGRGISICVHVILGLPGETKTDVLQTAEALNTIGIDGVKIHNLYVTKHTALARFWEVTGWQPIDRKTYDDWVVSFLERLCPNVVVQRLTGDPDPASLVAPSWAQEKQKILSLIDKIFRDRDTRQGAFFPAS